MIQQFINDMIHLTEGEKLVYYWPLWVGIIAISASFIIFMRWRKENE